MKCSSMGIIRLVVTKWLRLGRSELYASILANTVTARSRVSKCGHRDSAYSTAYTSRHTIEDHQHWGHAAPGAQQAAIGGPLSVPDGSTISGQRLSHNSLSAPSHLAILPATRRPTYAATCIQQANHSATQSLTQLPNQPQKQLPNEPLTQPPTRVIADIPLTRSPSHLSDDHEMVPYQ